MLSMWGWSVLGLRPGQVRRLAREGFLEVASRKKGQFEGGGGEENQQTLQAFLCLEVSSFHQYRWRSPQVGSKLPKVHWSLAVEKVSLVLTVRPCSK